MDVDIFPGCTTVLAELILGSKDLAGQVLLHAVTRLIDWKNRLDLANEKEVDGDSGLKFESTNLTFDAVIEGLGVAIGIEALIQNELANR